MRRPTPATTRLRRSPNSCRAKKRCRIVQKKLAPPNKKFRPKARSAVAMCTVDHANLYRSGRIKRMPTEMQEATPAEAGYFTSLRSRCAEIIVAHRTLRDKPPVSPISKSPRYWGLRQRHALASASPVCPAAAGCDTADFEVCGTQTSEIFGLACFALSKPDFR